ncbi:chromosome segregation SMC family protein [Deinococcus sonorensis]|uniref:Chromosome partition protein Smc n=2 Tax=Deinococcus sonorensis TaxID=309891 RepID=A0AAU7U9P5_9DEIO
MIGSITLQGFKSFADRTRLEFGPGVSAVIGPNGSGKSNVVEAIRWVTHQARARDLRAGRSSELIFHGSGGKAPLGLAEVQLELSDAQGQRLNLCRRVYRDGSTEQDLAGRPVRVRDVHSALRGTGLGAGGLAVIGQGEVGSVVQAEGRTLLGYLQEAAGLSRSVAAREETEQRLRGADDGLAQLQLLEDELRGRVQRLERAAQAARRQRELSLRQLALVEAQARHRHDVATRELAEGQQRVEALEAESAELALRIQAAAERLETLRTAVLAARERQQAQQQALELHSAAVRAADQAHSYHQHLERERQTLTAEQERLPLHPPEQPAPDTAALASALAATRERLDVAQREARRLDAQLTQARAEHSRAAEQQARAEAQHSTLSHEAATLQQALTTQRPDHEQALAALALAQSARAEAEAALAGMGEAGTTLRERQRQLQAELSAVQAARAPLQRERTRLEGLLNSYARYGEGARHALNSDHPGIVGSVADLLTVPADYETALGAALGRRLEQVVVQSADDAREIIDLLKRQGGRATFLPLDLLRPRPRRDAALLHEPGVLGNLADLCPSEPAIVGQNLLSDTLLIQDLGAATRLARRHASRPRLVTLEGELIEPGGALTGGRVRDSGVGVLADQRRFAELDDELAELDARQQRLERELPQLIAALGGEQERQAQARQRREAAVQQERQAERRATELGAQVQQLERQLLRLQQLSAGPLPERSTTTPLTDPATLEAPLQQLRADLEQLQAAEREQQVQLSGARDLQAAWSAHHAAVQRVGELSQRLAANAEALTRQALQLQAARQEVERRQAELGTLDPQALGRAEQARDAASQDYASQIGRQNRLRTQLDELRLTLARREGSLGSIPPGAQLPGTAREWQAELGRVQTELESIGVVNAAADDELAAEAGRLASLSAERHDAEQAVAELRGHLAELEQVEAQAITLAHQRVARAFAEYSGELLGGSGELDAERDGTGRLVGLALAVQPKGKRTRSLNLLSAGERTMAGLAFLFALNHAGGEEGMGGLPLAVLDEVDAPLDEANIRRFTRFLALFAERGSQFVLVTHQKATMEVAQALWGVTTDGSGASRVLSIRQAHEVA